MRKQYAQLKEITIGIIELYVTREVNDGDYRQFLEDWENLWRKKYNGMEVAEAEHLREPDAENTKPEELSVKSDSYEELFSQGLITERKLFNRYID